MSLGLPEILIILVIVLIIFGAGKLPRVMGDMAKGIGAFRKGLKDEEETKSVDNDEMVNVTPQKDETKASS